MSIDFTAIRAAIERLGGSLRTELEPQALARLLADRARLLARRTDVGQMREVLAQVLAVRRGRTLLGLPMVCVDEVRQVNVVPLPGGNAYVQGVFHVRGEVVCLLDAHPFFGAAEPLPADGATLAGAAGPWR